MKHYGDITQISGYDVPLVDIVTGGSPCQDLSVAGKRAGLDGERSGLFMEQIRIIKEMREHDRTDRRSDDDIRLLRPRYMVWENVPGAFSSNKGEDFRCVLEETARIADENASIPRPEGGKWSKAGCILGDGWSIAWRLHDAQFWGVPQRRKRICLLADFNGHTATEILFELLGETDERSEIETELGVRETSEPEIQSFGKSLSRDPEQSGEKRERATNSFEGNAIETISFQERAGCEGGAKASLSNEREQEHCQPSITNLSCQSNESSQDCICFELGAATRVGGHIYTDDIAGTIRANAGDNQQAVSIGNGQLNQISMDETANCLDTMHDQQAVITYGLDRASFNQGKNAQFDFSVEEDLIGAQVAKGPGAVASFYPQMKAESQCFRHDDISVTLVNGTNPGFQNGIIDSVVRRLTPMECERLQGYPDKWTDIGEWFDSTGKKHRDADTPRYKALGNSIALPFWGWLAERIVVKYNRPTTMASLFDGIGGFPLSFSRAGCEPIWASEIEEFPIAVTKLRFPDMEDENAN